MSYILDALKKSEAERSNAEPGESGHRVSFAATPGRQRAFWPYLLALALMANAAVVAYLVWPEPDPANEVEWPAEVAQVQRPEPEEQARTDTAAAGASGAATGSGEAASVASGAVPPEPSTEPEETAPARTERSPSDNTPSSQRTVDASEDVPPIHDMPRSVQQRVPEMTFNGHVWSSRASSRSVMINNRLLREGARFQGLIIEEITTAGVVFRLDGHVFEIDVVRDWQGGS